MGIRIRVSSSSAVGDDDKASKGRKETGVLVGPKRGTHWTDCKVRKARPQGIFRASFG